MDPKEIAKKVLGPNSYPAVVEAIVNCIRDAQANTLAGSELLSNTYKKLCESSTPMMEVKQFLTGAESIAVDDAELKTVLDFCKKAATTADLNCLINVCKEEHLLNLKKAGHPNPEKTIEELENEFNQASSVIEQGIRNGIFDKLNSKLLNDVKAGLGIEVNKELKMRLGETLNEGYQFDGSGFIKYTPIGITAETTDNRLVILTESDILSYDEGLKEYSRLDETEVLPLIDNKYKRLMEAISTCSYSPETKTFGLCESWDFNLELKDGKCFVGRDGNMNQIKSEALRNLLLESINAYSSGMVLLNEGVQFDKNRYMRDADNILMLMENHQNIIEFDDLKVVRNLNESGKYCLIDAVDVKNTNTPKLLSINGKRAPIYKSFGELCESANTELNVSENGFKFQSLFESQLINESQVIKNKHVQITQLREEQKSLNEGLRKIVNLKKLAEDNSPAMDKLNEQENILMQKLNENLENLNFYLNDSEI